MENIKTVFFICMSKNCISNLKKNLIFLYNFKKFSSLNIKILVIDSDSADGTKEYCKKLFSEKLLDSFIEVDDLEGIFNSRIERLSICRNLALEEIKKYKFKSLLYVPIDSDISVFEYIDVLEFENLIKSVSTSAEIEGIFPFSVPYYYDIFALRKKGWVNDNNLFKARSFKDKIKLGSFIFNYFYIFRKQLPKKNFKEDLISVESAFGGIGIYKIQNINTLNFYYSPDFSNINFVSEHVNFNLNFKKLFIKKEWNIPAPLGYIFFNNSNLKNKLLYLLRSFKNDFSKLL